MRTALPKQASQPRSHRPRAITVFAAAFVAGAAAAVGVNRALDVRLAQSKPRVESEAIFVALRSLPQGAPVTVWDVALRDWPKAMMPASALRASDTFSGHVLKHPLREGQPLLAIQLVPAGQNGQPQAEPTAFPPPAAYTQINTSAESRVTTTDGDLWAPAEPSQKPLVKPVQKSAQDTAQAPVQTETAPTSPAVTPESRSTADTAAVVVAEPLPQANSSETVTPDAIHDAVHDESHPSEPVLSESVAAEADSQASTIQAPTSQELISQEQLPQAVSPQEQVEQAPVQQPVAAAPVAREAIPAVAGPTADGEPADTTSAASTGTPADAPRAAVASPSEPAVAVTAAPPTQTPPAERPRPAFSRYLVVPERIAAKADSSFVAPAPVPGQPAVTTPEGAASSPAQMAQRSPSSAVRPLPATNTNDRVGQVQSRVAPAGPRTGQQTRQPQRQGRQPQPTRPQNGQPAVAPRGTPAVAPTQPRLGAAMFPNISAGVGAIESRWRGGQSDQGQAPAAARPITAR